MTTLQSQLEEERKKETGNENYKITPEDVIELFMRLKFLVELKNESPELYRMILNQTETIKTTSELAHRAEMLKCQALGAGDVLTSTGGKKKFHKTGTSSNAKNNGNFKKSTPQRGSHSLRGHQPHGSRGNGRWNGQSNGRQNNNRQSNNRPQGSYTVLTNNDGEYDPCNFDYEYEDLNC